MKLFKRYSWILVILMIAFIFVNSMTPAVSSKALSGNITTIILDGLSSIQVNMDYEVLHHFIRKLAHFTEYSILGIMVAFAIYEKPFIKSKLINFACFFLVPICDELIQKFTPGRSCEITDMLIDASGMIFGCLILIGIIKLTHHSLSKSK